MPQLELFVLGAFRAALDGVSFTSMLSDKGAALLAYLAVEGTHEHPRDTLAALLWPDDPEIVARHNLRQLLYKLKAALQANHVHASLQIERHTIRLSVRCDLHHFLDHCAAGAMREALALYTGELLEGFDCGSPLVEEWLTHKRTELHQRMLAKADAAAHAALQANRYDEAIAVARHMLKFEPWHEDAMGLLLRALIQSGQHAAALRQYTDYAQALRAELGVAPAAAIATIVAEVRRAHAAPNQPTDQGEPHQHDLLEMPAIHALYGRERELAQLDQWLTHDHTRLVMICGIGGVGKTSLAAHAVQRTQAHFEYVVWRSLVNAPPLDELIDDWLAKFSTHTESEASLQLRTATSNDKQRALLHRLQSHRCLIVLDNLESVMRAEDLAGSFRAGNEDYGTLLRLLAQNNHQSCILLTTREQPRGVAQRAPQGAVATLKLHGVSSQDAQQLLAGYRLTACTADYAALVSMYSGNALALKVVAGCIRDIHGGDVASYLREPAGAMDDVQQVLTEQFARLTALESDLLTWLAIEREPMSQSALWSRVEQHHTRRDYLEAITSLERRALLEFQPEGIGLQNVILEFATARLIETVIDEFAQEKPATLVKHSLMRAQAKDYVRQSQERQIVQPIVDLLRTRLGPAALKATIAHMLNDLRTSGKPAGFAAGFAAGNFLNLLAHCGDTISDFDASHLPVWQAYLPKVSLERVSFSESDLRQCVFRQDFTVVKSLAIDHTGHQLLMGTAHGTVRAWNLQSEQLDWSVVAHHGFVWALDTTPDGTRVFSGGSDGHVCEILPTTNQARRLHTHPGEVRGLIVNRAGERIFSVCSEGLLRAAQPDGIVIWERQFNPLTVGLALSPDERMLALSNGSNGDILLLCAADGSLVRTLVGHEKTAKGLSFSPDGQRLVSASNDHTLRIWNVATGATQRVLRGHSAWVWDARFNPSGDLIASSADDQTIRIWQADTGECITVLHGHSHWVRPILFHPSTGHLFSASDDQTLRLWDPVHGRLEWQQRGYTNWIRALAFNPNDGSLAVGTADHLVRIWRPDTGTLERQLRGHRNVVSSLAYSRDGRVLASGSVDGNVLVWDVPNLSDRSEPIATLSGHHAQIYGVAVNADGTRIASASADHSVIVWQTANARPIATLAHSDKVLSIIFTADDHFIITGSSDGTITVWDAATLQQRAAWRGHEGGTYALAAHPAHGLLASGSGDRSVRLWDIATGNRAAVGEMAGHKATIYGLAFDPSGDHLASGSYDQSIRLWDVVQRAPIMTVNEQAGFLRAVAFSADNQWLASGGADEIVRLYRAPNFNLQHTLKSQPPYAGLDISSATGLSPAQRELLQALGAHAQSAAYAKLPAH